jgi:hypothetical protein
MNIYIITIGKLSAEYSAYVSGRNHFITAESYAHAEVKAQELLESAGVIDSSGDLAIEVMHVNNIRLVQENVIL